MSGFLSLISGIGILYFKCEMTGVGLYKQAKESHCSNFCPVNINEAIY